MGRAGEIPGSFNSRNRAVLALVLRSRPDQFIDLPEAPVQTFEQPPVHGDEIRQEPDDRQKETGSQEERLHVTAAAKEEIEDANANQNATQEDEAAADKEEGEGLVSGKDCGRWSRPGAGYIPARS